MALPVLRICPRLLFCTLSKPVSCPHLIYSPIVNQQRLCSGFNDVKLGDNVDSFGEFEEISATDVLFTNVDIDAIVGDDLEKKKSLQVFISEMNMLMQTQQLVASKQLTPEQWLKLLKLRHEALRLSYLKRLFFKEKRKELRSFLSEEKRVSREQFRESKKNIPRVPRSTNSPLTYELGQTALFHRIQKPVMKQKQNFNLALTMCFGPDLVVDCSYEKYMTPAELFGCARQILFLWSTNRGNANPFNLIFCNLSPEAKIMEHLRFFFHKTEGDCSMLNFTEKSYTDLYRTEELVYLTPHCEEELEKYDGNSVYIIGAYVDEVVNTPVSLAKARRDGVRTAKFPLDKNLNWAQGSKLLPINQCLGIMNDLKDGANWHRALRHVATRKQSFQLCGQRDTKDTLKVSDKQARRYVRELARRDMVKDLNINQMYEKKDPAPEVDIL